MALPAPLEREPLLDYEILGRSSGPCSDHVWRAKSRTSPQVVALKYVHYDSDEMLQQAREEAAFRQSFSHPNLLKHFQIYQCDSSIIQVMEDFQGFSLSSLLAALKKPFEEQIIQYIIAEVLKALVFLHSHNMLHRQIRAYNIGINLLGQVKLDYGTSPLLDGSNMKTGTLTKDPFWMAPEEILDQVFDEKSDVWSLGITALELAEMKTPLGHLSRFRAIFVIPSAPAPVLKDQAKWSVDFQHFLSKALMKKPADRPSSKDLSEHAFLQNLPQLHSSLVDLVMRTEAILRTRQLRYQDSESESDEDFDEEEE